MSTCSFERPFPITSVCKDDIVQACLDKNGNLPPPEIMARIESMDEDDMHQLASDMADDYCDQLFWDSLEIIFTMKFL